MRKGGKIVVAMSGGIDSSVTAALLKRGGFLVAGVFMKFWFGPTSDEIYEGFNRCCSLEAENRAREIASLLEIPFYLFDFREDFKKKVVDSFIEEYRLGRTPNPCVECNEKIKLGMLLKKADLMGFDLVATGHYVRKIERDGKFYLLRGLDKNKDQSYFLWKINQQQLKQLIFPLGDYTKSEVGKIAKRLKLPLSGIKESMEVCFIKDSLGDFLLGHIKEKPGDIITREGKIIGKHSGLFLYTIGQRKGIGLSGGPYFVKEKDQEKNLLIVTKDKKLLEKNCLKIKEVNWISGKEPSFPLEASVQIRYDREAFPAKIEKKKDILEIIFKSPQTAIAPGQSAVIYDKETLLGGGVIQ